QQQPPNTPCCCLHPTPAGRLACPLRTSRTARNRGGRRTRRHREMNYSHRLNRDECDAIIAQLVRLYPACFFEDPRLRRPLKKNILADLREAGVPFALEETAAAVKWYESHFAYQYALQAGAKRVDLAGRDAGTVTETEQRDAERYVVSRKQEMQAREV